MEVKARLCSLVGVWENYHTASITIEVEDNISRFFGLSWDHVWCYLALMSGGLLRTYAWQGRQTQFRIVHKAMRHRRECCEGESICSVISRSLTWNQMTNHCTKRGISCYHDIEGLKERLIFGMHRRRLILDLNPWVKLLNFADRCFCALEYQQPPPRAERYIPPKMPVADEEFGFDIFFTDYFWIQNS